MNLDNFIITWLFAAEPRPELTDAQFRAWVRFRFAAMSWLRGCARTCHVAD